MPTISRNKDNTLTDLLNKLFHALLWRESQSDLGDVLDLAPTLLLRWLKSHLAGGQQTQHSYVLAVGILRVQRHRRGDGQ